MSYDEDGASEDQGLGTHSGDEEEPSEPSDEEISDFQFDDDEDPDNKYT